MCAFRLIDQSLEPVEPHPFVHASVHIGSEKDIDVVFEFFLLAGSQRHADEDDEKELGEMFHR